MEVDRIQNQFDEYRISPEARSLTPIYLLLAKDQRQPAAVLFFFSLDSTSTLFYVRCRSFLSSSM
jgi:hypothetical protein